jgi:hypothetical protein
MTRGQQSPVLGERLGRVRDHTQRRLAAVDLALPERKGEMPFTEYLARASIRAQNDPEFRTELQRSLANYQTLAQAFKKGGR